MHPLKNLKLRHLFLVLQPFINFKKYIEKKLKKKVLRTKKFENQLELV